MNEVKVFNFEESEIRSILIDNEIYFIGKDVANILGYARPQKAIKDLVDREDTKTLKYKACPNLGLWGNHDFSDKTVITESGIYSLVFNSEMPNAKKFKRWVTSEVLPSIRKNGAYLTDQKALDITTNPSSLADLLLQAGEQLKQKDITIQQLKPKAMKYDSYIQAKGTINVSIIAKNYGMCARKFNELLHELGIQYKQKNTWLLYAKYQDKKYTHIEGFTYKDSDGIENIKTTTKWTANGHMFLYDLLKSHGYYPNIELMDSEDDTFKMVERRM